MAKKPARPNSARLLMLASTVVMLASVLTISALQPKSLSSPKSTSAASSIPTTTPFPPIRTAHRPPSTITEDHVNINDLVIGDTYGPLRLRELKVANVDLSDTPQVNNFALTFQGVITVTGTLDTNRCLMPTQPDLPHLPHEHGAICFDSLALLNQSGINPNSIVSANIDNYTLLQDNSTSTRTATLISIFPPAKIGQ